MLRLSTLYMCKISFKKNFLCIFCQIIINTFSGWKMPLSISFDWKAAIWVGGLTHNSQDIGIIDRCFAQNLMSLVLNCHDDKNSFVMYIFMQTHTHTHFFTREVSVVIDIYELFYW